MGSHDHRFNGDDAGYDSPTMSIGEGMMLAAVIALFTAVIFYLCLHIYVRYFLRRRGSLRRRRLAFVGEQDPPRLQNVGLGKSAIEALPLFIYQSENYNEGLECAVCLCEFEGNEKGRLLPKCHHSFHIDCIDMWFHSHSTCPLCRASALLDTPADSVVVVVEDAASGSVSETEQQVPPVSEGNASISRPEHDHDIDLCHSCRHNEDHPSLIYPTNVLRGTQNRVASLANPAFSDQRITSSSREAFDKIVIGIPRRGDSFCSPRLFSSDDQQVFSPSGQSLKSPSIRLRSLKRLLSKDKIVVQQNPDDGRNIPFEQGDSFQN